ncbi:MAG: hypothetical protein LBR21_07840 [Propionibacteriaceae bacterium]|jgi:hypothetical protein|nr:hypothetical protein [Propionibacteriaceae bacterium]
MSGPIWERENPTGVSEHARRDRAQGDNTQRSKLLGWLGTLLVVALSLLISCLALSAGPPKVEGGVTLFPVNADGPTEIYPGLEVSVSPVAIAQRLSGYRIAHNDSGLLYLVVEVELSSTRATTGMVYVNVEANGKTYASPDCSPSLPRPAAGFKQRTQLSFIVDPEVLDSAVVTVEYAHGFYQGAHKVLYFRPNLAMDYLRVEEYETQIQPSAEVLP